MLGPISATMRVEKRYYRSGIAREAGVAGSGGGSLGSEERLGLLEVSVLQKASTAGARAANLGAARLPSKSNIVRLVVSFSASFASLQEIRNMFPQRRKDAKFAKDSLRGEQSRY